MVLFNLSSDNLGPFILVGIPGLEHAHVWIGIPFCIIYIVAIVGNCILLYLILVERSLHKPMFFFLSMLAMTDLTLSTAGVPKTLSIFWLGAREITFPGFGSCMAQMFFIHFFTVMESGVLLVMSFDRYVAICNPLRYTTMLTDSHVVCMGLWAIIRSFCMIFPLPFLLKRLPFCKANVLSHAYCLHSDLIHLPCGDVTINNIFGLIIVMSTFVLDSALILFSYVLILRSVLAFASREERLKTLNTCVSHLCAVLIFYVPKIAVSMTARFGRHVPRLVYTVMSLIFLFVPPMLNPVIYSIKTKQIRWRLGRMLVGNKF
ncbi:unnamed protein product [Rangifer tarandus platyrhynchus]|uniref:Olfactory receptor n=1 Tax=Rangifer tarandus platyrhynchus TaxID=3082113 RepID=A0ABN8XUX1_RANTA|nr:unnamed protein product [Rangifer tarandus platyrhynchus]